MSFKRLSPHSVYPGHALVMLRAQRQRVEITGPAPHAYTGADVMDMDAERTANGAWKLCDSAHVFAAGHFADLIGLFLGIMRKPLAQRIKVWKAMNDR